MKKRRGGGGGGVGLKQPPQCYGAPQTPSVIRVKISGRKVTDEQISFQISTLLLRSQYG